MFSLILKVLAAHKDSVKALEISIGVQRVNRACCKVRERVRRDSVISILLNSVMKEAEALDSPEYNRRLDTVAKNKIVQELKNCRQLLASLAGLIQDLSPEDSYSRHTAEEPKIFSLCKELLEIQAVLAQYHDQSL